MNNIRLVTIDETHPNIISKAFTDQGWNKSLEQYEGYFAENKTNKRVTILAFVDDEFAGYGNIIWKSNYLDFKKDNIPEIVDLNTLIRFRNIGVASKILDELEKVISKRSNVAGIGVGLIKDYGAAQRLYANRGYIPNGKGAYYKKNNLGYFEELIADDDLVLYLTKSLSS